MTKLSLLDLLHVTEGGDVRRSLANAVDMARHAETLGFERYWCAEHHGMEGIASAATSVVIGHVAAGTGKIRVGAGGIMLPNHSPLVIAEQFGTLDALFPGRIDLGLGRAPGSDQRVAAALRRNLDSNPDAFPRDVVELQSYFADDGRTGIRATPGAGADVQLYILGSSLFGAQVAAMLGLPYAFASHFAPQALDDALKIYRDRFEPSAVLSEPYAICGYNVFAADTEEEAQLLASSMQQSFVRLRTGQPGKLPPPVEGYRESLPPQLSGMLDGVLSATAIGTRDQVREQMNAFVERTQADELIIAGSIYDHEARKRSLALAAEAFAGEPAAA
ncbi:alkane 1-monooxygenase [Citromicrobium sp. RCC1885]|uniref:LLM class flavin-dependent oxidoreductase n=1 Tax=unclassified Citromicrobium TaxID=2630544 RepID=UPI0006C93083|nr:MULTISPECIES: LLM class flavin-dependent oxidoreductase [unclassified Citromicrobium]KPM25041.1 alkane 1-monooxygenase [Citromicrobium sp. RCC1885]KPM28282.1 alkane 1-monooxygenase [Citromicrobium sp. RCC1878]OAM10192.1 alkane 1-monooxygenase [Citromicrobium sp. RCC1897]|tara:strand:- start:3166 stop:4164 length:999 start_codon:yes stop_codon:yes gene_type:complete